MYHGKYHLLYEYKDLLIDMAVRNNRSELAIANRHQERWNFTRWKIIVHGFWLDERCFLTSENLSFSVLITELYYSLEERLGMKKCRQKHGGFWALLTPLGTYGYRYLPLTNRDAMLLTKSFAPLVFAKKFMAFLFSGQSLREKSFLFRLWT